MGSMHVSMTWKLADELKWFVECGNTGKAKGKAKDKAKGKAKHRHMDGNDMEPLRETYRKRQVFLCLAV